VILFGIGAIAVALLAAAVLLGRGGGPLDPPQVVTSDPPQIVPSIPTGVAEPGGTAAAPPPSTPIIPAAVVEPAPVPVMPSPAPPPVPEPAGPRPGEVVENSLGMKLVVIPEGTFRMGSSEGDDEQPIATVQITRPFLLGRTEVTLGQFFEFYADGYEGRLDCEQDGKGGYGYDAATLKLEQQPRYGPWNWGHPDIDLATEAGRRDAFRHPVVNVSWNDCVAFCKWLSRKEGKTYRLPTEAEWEYACRAGTTTRYWTGDDPESLAASENIADGTAQGSFPGWTTIRGRDGHVFTAPVGSFGDRNPFGLADMHGNVAEWCSDWYAEDAYAAHLPLGRNAGLPSIDPTGPPVGSYRVVRGGGWSYEAGNCRSAHRGGFPPSTRDFSIGFRVARDVE
jgi:sulfatase modifying factor 1